MDLSIHSTARLGGSVEIPRLGFGVFKSAAGSEVENAVAAALDCGYRHVDTASIYKNEEGVGRAIAASGIDRSEIFVTTKVWNSDQGYDSTLAAIDDSLKRLGMTYVDLYLVHWPKPKHTRATWRAMEKLLTDGRARAIGVSNFLPQHLDQLAEHANVMPSINQIEFHPHLQSPGLVSYCRDRDIVVEAWSPLKQGQIVNDPGLATIAASYSVSVPQVVLRWMLQRGIVTIPKSVTPARIDQNADLYTFELADGDMVAIDAMNRDDRVGPDPGNFDF